MNKNTGNFETTLECGHVVTTQFKPPGAEYYCLRHGKMTRTLNSLKKYFWHCYTCNKRRYYIATRLRGETIAMRHHRADRSHHVVYKDIDGKTWWESHPAQTEQLALDI